MVIEVLKALINIPIPFNMIVLVVLFGSISGAIIGVSVELRKYASHRQTLQFKRDLVERGLGGDEIEQIVAAQTPSNAAPSKVGNYYAAGAPAVVPQTA
jgi:hypothetical protein